MEPQEKDNTIYLKGSSLDLWIPHTDLNGFVVTTWEAGITHLILLDGQLYLLKCV